MSERITSVPDLDAALDEHIAQGFRLDMIMPADAPHMALISRGGERLRLVVPYQAPPTTDAQAFVITHASDQAWSPGRAPGCSTAT